MCYQLETQLGAGLLKFRTQDAWDENWGGSEFPQGQAIWFGDNIVIPEAGRYRVSIDLVEERYSFERLGD